MAPMNIFNIQLVLGYAAWGLCFGAYLWPRLSAMDVAQASRAIAMLHGFRFFGLVFILPGIVSSGIPAGFANPAALGDLATGVLAMLAVASFRLRPLFWLSVVAFNVVGAADLGLACYHAASLHLPEVSGQLGPAYLIPILYVPILAITHGAAFVLIGRQLRGVDFPARSSRGTQLERS